MAGCLSGIAKYILFFFNFLIVLCGIAFIALGAVALSNEGKGIKAITEYSIPGFAIAVGVIIFFIAFLGCCGAIKENGCMLTTYAVVMILLFILQIALGALAFVAIKNDDGEFDKSIHNVTKDFFDEYFNNQNEDNLKAINAFQDTFKCCGVDSIDDFGKNGAPIPNSCCEGKTTCNTSNAYKGCANIFADVFKGGFTIVGGIAIGFAIVELAGAIFACVVKNRR